MENTVTTSFHEQPPLDAQGRLNESAVSMAFQQVYRVKREALFRNTRNEAQTLASIGFLLPDNPLSFHDAAAPDDMQQFCAAKFRHTD